MVQTAQFLWGQAMRPNQTDFYSDNGLSINCISKPAIGLKRDRLNFVALLKNFLRPLHTLLRYTMVQKDMVQTAQVLWGQEFNSNHAF